MTLIPMEFCNAAIIHIFERMEEVMKKIMLFVVLCSMMVGLMACSQKDTNVAPKETETSKTETETAKTEEPVKISLMLWDEAQSPVIQESIDKFNQENKGKIEASIELVPWDTYWTKLDASMASNETADVVWMNVYLPKYVKAELVKPLDDYIKNDNVDMSQYVEGRVSAFNVNNQQYALPKGLDSVFVAYNKEIFDKYGVGYPKENWTWEDMRSISGELRDKISEAKGSEYPIVMELDGQPSWINFVYQNGGNYISADGKTTGMGDEKSVGAIQNMIDLMNDNLMAPYTVLSETKGTDLFLSGQGAIVFIGSWKASVLENSTLAQAGNIGLVQMPSLNGSNISTMGGLGYCLTSASKHPDEAWKLIQYITSYESLNNEAVNSIDIPALKEAQGGYLENFKNINAEVIINASLTGFPYPSNGDFSWTSYVDDAVQQALAQERPAKEALENGAAAAQKILDDLYK